MNLNWVLMISVVCMLTAKHIVISHSKNKMHHVTIDNKCTRMPILTIHNSPEWISMQWTGLPEELTLNITMVQLLKIKGYLRVDTQTANLYTGYVYYKQLQKDTQLLDQLGLYITNLSDIVWTNLRMEDHFQVSVDVQSSVCELELQYTYATVDVSRAPSEAQRVDYHPNQPQNTVTRKLWGTGFHQTINYTVQLPAHIDISIIPHECALVVTDIVPQSTYVDAYELQNITQYETINVQTPAYNSKQYYYHNTILFSQAIQVGVRKYLFRQPIHFRYSTPSEDEYSYVYLHPAQQIQLQCWSYHPLKVDLIQLTPQRGRAKIPVGDLGSARIVSVITLVSSLLGVMLITGTLQKPTK